MMRCCEGETYVRPEPPRYDENAIGVASHANLRNWPGRHNDPTPPLSWAVCCFDCDAVLAVVNGVEREEVYALV